MAFVPVAKAKSGRPASSAENNKLIDNVNDLHARMGDAFTAENNVSVTMQATIDSVSALDSRLGEGVGSTDDPVTGTATAQFSALRDRVAAVEGATGAAYSVHSFRQTSKQTLVSGSGTVGWNLIRFDVADINSPASDVVMEDSTYEDRPGTVFRIYRAGVWRVTFTGSLASQSQKDARVLICAAPDPLLPDARSVYSEHIHPGATTTAATFRRYSDSVSGLKVVPEGGVLACWIWHNAGMDWDTETDSGRSNCSFEWVAPLPE